MRGDRGRRGRSAAVHSGRRAARSAVQRVRQRLRQLGHGARAKSPWKKSHDAAAERGRRKTARPVASVDRRSSSSQTRSASARVAARGVVGPSRIRLGSTRRAARAPRTAATQRGVVLGRLGRGVAAAITALKLRSWRTASSRGRRSSPAGVLLDQLEHVGQSLGRPPCARPAPGRPARSAMCAATASRHAPARSRWKAAARCWRRCPAGSPEPAGRRRGRGARASTVRRWVSYATSRISSWRKRIWAPASSTSPASSRFASRALELPPRRPRPRGAAGRGRRRGRSWRPAGRARGPPPGGTAGPAAGRAARPGSGRR